MNDFLLFGGVGGLFDIFLKISKKFVSPDYKSLYPYHSTSAPWHHLVKRRDKHFIHSKRVCSILVYQIIGIYNITKRLGHFAPIFGKNNPMRGASRIRLHPCHQTLIIQKFINKTRIKQVQGSMLHAPVIEIHWHPMINFFPIGKNLVVFRVKITQK